MVIQNLPFFRSLTSYFSSEAPPAEQEEKASEVKNEWIVQAPDADVFNHSAYKFNLSTDYCTPSSSEDIEVIRNQWIVTEATEPRPYVMDIDRSIVVLTRTVDSKGKPKQLGLAYVDTTLEPLKHLFDVVIKQTNGDVEVFITGGTRSTDKFYQKIRQYIQNVSNAQPRRHITLKDDYFKAVDVGSWSKDSKGNGRQIKIKQAGFDKSNNPFMIMDYINAR